MVKEVLYVFLGGGIGSILRYFVSGWLNPLIKHFPLGTLTSNVVSSFILGFAFYLFLERIVQHDMLRLMVMIGLCGGFSTFSTFTFENYNLLKEEQYVQLLLYVSLSLTVSLAAFFSGIMLARQV